MNTAYELGFFSEKLWSKPIYTEPGIMEMFNYTCEGSNLPSIEDFHQVSMENVQLLLKTCAGFMIVASFVHLLSFKCIRIHILNRVLLLLAWMAIGLLKIAETFITLLVYACKYLFELFK